MKRFLIVSILGIWCLFAATPASAQSEWGDPEGGCYGAVYYPGHSVTMGTHIHYNETGADYWYWNSAWEYVDNGNIAYGYNDINNNYNASCEPDVWADDGYFTYIWFHIPISHTVVAHPFSFIGFAAPQYCAAGFPNIVESAVFREGQNQPWYEMQWRPGGFPPIAADNQAVYIPSGQASYNVYAYTCGSTYPAPYFTEYTWKTYVFGIYGTGSTWNNWWDYTDIVEHYY